MPFIVVPFKRVVVDIVGLTAPPSEAEHRYILTLVDYATRYPEEFPLKKNNTKAVAEALLDIYSRVNIPEEVSTPFKSLRFCLNACRKYPDYSA